MGSEYRTPPAWARWLMRHMDKATTPEAAKDVINGVHRNYFVSRSEVLHFVSHINKAVKSLAKDQQPDDVG